jgi:hypothetical protein
MEANSAILIKKILFTTALMLLPGSAPAAGCPDAACSGAVFCSGFEEGNKAAWDDYDGNPDSTNLIMTDPGPCNSPDNHIMRLRVPPGRGGERIVENILCGLPKGVTIKGGYDDQGFTTNSGYTAFPGSFTIGRGTVVLDRIVIFLLQMGP